MKKPKNFKWALRMALDALRKQRQTYAVDRNLAAMLGGPQTPAQESSVRNYNDMTEALDILRRWAGPLLVLLFGLVSLACAQSAQSPQAAEPPTVEPTPSGNPPGGAMEPAGEGPVIWIVCVDALNIRSEPNYKAPVVGWLDRGDRVRVLEWRGGWARMRFGWVLAKYLAEGNE